MEFDLNVEPPLEHARGFDLNLEPEDAALDDVIDSTLQYDEEAPIQGTGRKKDMTEEFTKLVFQTLLARSNNGKLGKKDTAEVAEQFGISLRSTQKLWKRGKTHLDQGIPVDVASRKRGRNGRKKIPVDLERLRNVPLKDRMTLEDVSKVLGISKSTLHRYLQQGLLRRHSNSIKPYLTDANKMARLRWAVDMVDQGSSSCGDPRFKGLFDHVFIDEKWFFLTQKSENYYLLPDEDEPHRTCKSKNYIPRLMFLCVTARPRFRNGQCIFDGKIGCFPLVTYEHAQRRSANRPAGALVVKPITSITRDVIRDFMINQVLPAIREKWPREEINQPIYIQQDNAPSHLEVNDPLFCEAAKKDGFDIRLKGQPPNSPDMNILDLGFFRAIQSIQYKKHAKTVEDLIPVVQEAFHEYCPKKANMIYLTLQGVFKETMKAKGCNRFKIPHMAKGHLENQGRLPLQLTCETSLLADSIATLAASSN